MNNETDSLGLYDGRNEMVSNRFHRGEKTTWEMEENDKQRSASCGKRKGARENQKERGLNSDWQSRNRN